MRQVVCTLSLMTAVLIAVPPVASAQRVATPANAATPAAANNTALEAKLYALVYERAGDEFPPEAIPLIESWAKREPKNATALAYLAQYQRWHLEDSKLGEETAQKALAINPGEPVAMFVRARNIEDLDKNKGAKGSIPFYVKALEAKPDFSRAHYYLGVTYREVNRPADAKASLLMALATTRNPEFGMYTHLANALLSLREYDEAEKMMRKSLELESKFEYQWEYLAEILMDAKKYPEAEVVYRQAGQKFGREFFAEGLANSLKKQGKSKEAKEALRDVRK